MKKLIIVLLALSRVSGASVDACPKLVKVCAPEIGVCQVIDARDPQIQEMRKGCLKQFGPDKQCPLAIEVYRDGHVQVQCGRPLEQARK